MPFSLPHFFFFFFCHHLFFCDHFEELQAVFIEVKLIIINAPLTFVYSNTIKKYLTPTHLVFGEELLCYSNTTQAVFIEVKLIIINAPLTFVYSNTIKKYLTPNHLVFGEELLCYSNTTSAVIRNLTVLSSTTDKINRISNHFWHRWRHEYVVNLRETQRASKLYIKSQKLCCASLWWKGAQTLLENCHSNRGIT